MRRSVGVLLSVVLGTAVLGGLAFTSGSVKAAEQRKPQRLTNPEIKQPDHMDVLPALRDVKPIPPDWYSELGERDEHPVRHWPHHHPLLTPQQLKLVKDAARQQPAGRLISPLVSATPGLNFDGVGSNTGYSITGAPPDTNGAIGATQYVQWVNTAFAVFDKTTGSRVFGPANGNTLWSGFGGRCQTDNSGDPIAMYDQIANRWIMMQFAVSASPFFQCVAVSQTSDATGAWNRYSYQFSNFNDYPKGGVWPDAYYVTYNMFNAAGTAFLGAQVCAMDRASMLTGAAATQQCFQLSTTYGGLLPAYLDGATLPPSGAPNYVLAFNDTALNALWLWKFHVDWTTPANSTLTGPTSIPVTAFTEACSGGTCIPQSGTTQQLDSLADRLMYRLAYRNFGDHESLVTNHSVTSGGVSGIRWYEIRSPGGTPSVFQQSTFQPDAAYRWMGSIAQDKSGNMLLGYSASSSSIHPAVRVTGRLATDAANTMQAETSIFAGPGSQTGSSLSRWGDYSAMTIDPADDCTFWYTQEYEPANGAFNWATRIASFKFSSCGGTPTPDFSVSASPSSVSVVQGGGGTSTITVGSINSFNSAVSLSASGLPSGVTASFAPTSVTPPANGSGTSTLTLAASAGATVGTATVTVTGTSGSTTHTASISLTVSAAGASTAVYDPTLKAPKCTAVGSSCDSGASLLLGRAGLGPEPNQPNTINSTCADGASGTFHSDESNDRLKVATTDASNFAPGKTVTVTATVWAWTTPSSDHLDLYYAADASSPSWTLITTLTPSAAGANTLSANYTLPTGGANQAVRATFRYTGSASACGTNSGYDDHDDLIFAVGAGAPDTTPPTTSITAPANGATVGGTVNVTASASDNVGVTKVEFYVDGALASTDTTSPYSFSWVTTGYTNGSTHTLVSKAYDAANNVGTSATVTVTVDNSATAQNAVYDTTLKAPKCAVVGISCDSGASLLLGRASLGPEPNQPNTINNSCADGTSGTFHSDESNDRIKVATTDGTALAAGKTVTITATVWAWTTPSADHLDLYYAANANSPTWTFIATLTPTAAGARTLTANYTLPTGGLQAVRANFRYNSSAGVCVAGAYTDHDDLVFAVQ